MGIIRRGKVTFPKIAVQNIPNKHGILRHPIKSTYTNQEKAFEAF